MKCLPLRLEHRVADHIGMDYWNPARRQDVGNGALAGTDASREENTSVATSNHGVTVL